jgi:hypothetical protein
VFDPNLCQQQSRPASECRKDSRVFIEPTGPNPATIAMIRTGADRMTKLPNAKAIALSSSIGGAVGDCGAVGGGDCTAVVNQCIRRRPAFDDQGQSIQMTVADYPIVQVL